MDEQEKIKYWLKSFHKRILDSKLCELIYAEEMTAIIDASDLIDEQEAEIEKLKEDRDFYEKKETEALYLTEKYRKENKKLKAENYNWRVIAKDAKTAVKEFAEKLKSKLYDLEGIVQEDDIDELLKEYEVDE